MPKNLANNLITFLQTCDFEISHPLEERIRQIIREVHLNLTHLNNS